MDARVNALAPFRFHPVRDRLIAEAHARPPTPLPAPSLASRIVALSGEDGAARDFAHMVALCRRLGAPEPSPGARWAALDAGLWRLRWERHTEASTWTLLRTAGGDVAAQGRATALDLAPQDWLSEIPGDILAAVHVAVLRAMPSEPAGAPEELIAAELADGAASVFTDFRPGPDRFTRFVCVVSRDDPALTGRLVQQLFEIEQYRLMALLAFPLAGEAGEILSRLEESAAAAAADVRLESAGPSDRALLARLAALAGEAQALSGRTGFRFRAARAYYGIVLERVRQLREQRLGGHPVIAEFMERRLAPAMRTCAAVEERLAAVAQHLARTSQLLQARVEVAAEETNAGLLASMDRRAQLQLRLQQAVEGLSVAAISYYAVGLLAYVFKAIEHEVPGFDASLMTGLAAPVTILAAFLALRRLRRRLAHAEPPRAPSS